MSASIQKLSLEQSQARLADVPHWELLADRGGLLRRSFKFRDFQQAFAFMTEMAAWSEAAQHHPEWFNVYAKVDVDLTTHDVGGLSEKDFAWARRAHEVAAAIQDAR